MNTSRKDFLKLASFGFAGVVLPAAGIASGTNGISQAIKEGKKISTYRIELAPDASESEKWAATELQHWLYEISGEYVALTGADKTYSGGKIVLGYNDIVKAKTGAPAPADGDESYHYFSKDGNVYIYGGK
ncbi:MAG: hypothetical protein ACTHLE_20070, partial [Agriterribacter sp.]